MTKNKPFKKRSQRKSSEFSLREQYQKTFSFIKESKNFIYSAILFFLIFTAIGFFFRDFIDLVVKGLFNIDLTQNIIDYIQQLLKQTEGLSYLELMKFIFLNNLQSSFFGMIFGIVFGIFPFIALVSNGYILGFVSYFSVKSEGALVLWKLFPHGIFELPAIFISLGIGLKLGSFVFTKDRSFKAYVLESLRVFLLVILPLLIIAAIIESTLIFFGS
jgi:stage II sporulation protein M